MASEKELQTKQDDLLERLSNVHYREINPFRGLEFFDAEHAPFFHGRTKIIGEVLDVLRQKLADKRPFLLLLGPEGSGKTSLVRAGIVSALTQGRVTEGVHSWRLAFTRPGDRGAGDPFDALAAALLERSALPEFPDAATQNGYQNLAAELREGPDNTALRLRETLQYLSMQALDHILDKQEFEVPPADPEQSAELPRQNKPARFDSKVQLAVVVDQLEDLFVRGYSPELQEKFITALGALVRWRVAVVIAVLRSDFCASFQNCCNPKDFAVPKRQELRVLDIDLSEVLTGKFDLPRPSPLEIAEMIRLPAQTTGLRFELDPETGRNLDAALLEAASAHAEPLPALEHVLWHLYQKQLPRRDGLLRWSDYRESGELEGALANHAETVFSALDGDAQAALRPIVRQLVSPGPGKEGVLIRRMVPYRDLTSMAEFSEHQKAAAERLIDLFIKEGLLHAEPSPNAEMLVSFTQEYVLRNWPRVRQLLNEDPGFRTRDRLEPNFKLWFNGGRRNRNLVRIRSGVRVAAALFRGFRTLLIDTLVNYLQRSLRAKNRRRWLRGAAVLVIVAGLVAPMVIPGVDWLRANIERQKAEQASGPESRGAQSANTKPESLRVEESRKGNGAQLPQGNAPIATSGQDALQGRLNDAEAKTQQAQKDAAQAGTQREALQSQLEDIQAKARQAQKNAGLATQQSDALQPQLKDAKTKSQQAQKNAELVEAQAEKGDQSSGESAQNSANRTESKQSQQPNADLKADPLASSIQPAHTTAMSRSATEGTGSAEATVGHQEPMKFAQTDQRTAALPQPSQSQPASAKPPHVEARGGKITEGTADEAAVKRFVLDYIRTIASDDVSTQERFFAQRVNFYGEGVLPLQRVQASNERYRREWPSRDWQPQGEPEILHASSKQYEVLQPFTWKVSNGTKHAEGSATLYLRIWKNTGGEFQIVRVGHHER